jgi:NitT/TauT family transport system permease protein
MTNRSAANRELTQKLETVVLPLLAFGALVALWHLGVILSGSEIFPTPAKVVRGLIELYQTGRLFRYTADSLMRVAAGYGLAVVLGLPVGLLMGLSPSMQALLNSLFQMLRPISPLAWIPLAILLFGVNNTAPVFLVFIASFFPIVVSATTGVQNIPPMYMRAGSNHGLSTTALLFRVIFPAALPQIITGLRLSLGVAWLVVVAAEMIAVPSGLGYLVMDSRNAGQRYDLVVGSMLLIGLIGLGLDVLLRRLETLRAVRWGFRTDDN